MDVNIDTLYAVLIGRIVNGNANLLFYSQLSEMYERLTGVAVDYHRGWRKPLGELNQRLCRVGAPALSALVVLKPRSHETPEPGPGFWGCADNVPPRPKNAMTRLETWNRILLDLQGYDWPPSLTQLMLDRPS